MIKCKAVTGIILSVLVTTLAWAQSAKIRVGVQPIPPDAVFMARDWQKTYGVDLEATEFSSGGDMAQAFIAGKLDIVNQGSGRLVTLAANQPNLFQIIAVRQSSGDRYGLMVPRKSSVTNIAQLKGKKIAAVFGAGSHGTFRLYLEKKGLTEMDFQMVNMKEADMQAALQQGLVDAAFSSEPQGAIAEAAGVSKRIASMKGISESPNFVLVSRRFAEANPKLLTRFLAASRDEAEFIQRNPEEAGKLAASHVKKRGVAVDPQALALALSRTNIGGEITDALLAEMVPIAESMKAANKIREVPNFNALVNATYYQNALKINVAQGSK